MIPKLDFKLQVTKIKYKENFDYVILILTSGFTSKKTNKFSLYIAFSYSTVLSLKSHGLTSFYTLCNIMLCLITVKKFFLL